MDEQNTAQLASSAERLAAAADAIEAVLARIEASQQTLNEKVDRIIAAIEETATREREQLQDGELASARTRVSELQRQNEELKAQASRVTRKTLSPLVAGLLSKNGVEDSTAVIEAGALDKALATLSIDQRIAVKAELARAGMIG